MKYTYEDILEKMQNEYKSHAHREVDSDSTENMVLKTLATELFSLSCYGDYILKQSFVQTATGEHLDRLGAIRGCERKTSSKATGSLTFSVLEPTDIDVDIAKGTICSVDDDPLLQYETTQDAVLSAGNLEITVPAQALDYGNKYNAPAEKIKVMVNAPVSIAAVTNPTSFSGGYDGESDEAFRKRILNAFKTPSYYYSRSEIKNRILQCEDIIDCSVPEIRTDNHVEVAVRSKFNNKVGDIENEINDLVGINKLLGIRINVSLASVRTVKMDIAVRTKFKVDRDEIEESIRSYVKEYFSGEKIGESLFVSPIVKYIYSLNNIDSVEISSQSILADLFYCDWNEYLVLNNVTVTIYE